MNKKKLYVWSTVICGAAMFLWILLTVYLTGARELRDFTSADKRIFIGFLIVEAITLFLMFFFAVKAGKLNQMDAPPPPKPTATDKVMKRRSIVLTVGAVIVALAVYFLGFILVKEPAPAFRDGAEIAIIVLLVLTVLYGVFSVVAARRFLKRLQSRKVADTSNELNSYRENAAETAGKKRALLLRLITLNDALTVLFTVFGFAIAFLLGASHLSDISFYIILTIYLLMAAACRIRQKPPKTVFEDDGSYVTREDYPELYRIAEKAQSALGHTGKVRISLAPDMNAGIGKIGDVYSVRLGVLVLDTMCEEELYSILLHEFGHLVNTGKGERRIEDYSFWSQFGQTNSFFSLISQLLFRYTDLRFDYELALYNFAVSVQREAEADRAMAHCGSAETAASALLKLKYYELYDWEKGGRVIPSDYMPEKPEKGYLTRELSNFRAQLSRRQKDWNELTRKEILSRSASHPTIAMRLEALGISDYRLIDDISSEAYRNDCQKALDWAENKIVESVSESYDEAHENEYLKPLRDVEKWEQAGKPLVTETYSDLVEALCLVGRDDDAEALCRRAIDELSGAAAVDAVFRLGCRLLHRYDDEGIPLVYRAIENNHNYIEEGAEIIGAYCLLTGNQSELDAFRAQAPALGQKDVDETEELGNLKRGDRIGPEQLPNGMLDDILSYISGIDDGSIDKIYLVKKTISEAFSTSVFIVRFTEKAEHEARYEIMHKIFRYLDTCSDWQFSLFDYGEVRAVKPERVEGSLVYSKE